MSEMVERVATAICKSKTCEGISCCDWPAQRGRLDCPVKRGAYNDAARDAIEAMREPTDGMLAVVYGNHGETTGSDKPATETWQAMIDEALK